MKTTNSILKCLNLENNKPKANIKLWLLRNKIVITKYFQHNKQI